MLDTAKLELLVTTIVWLRTTAFKRAPYGRVTCWQYVESEVWEGCCGLASPNTQLIIEFMS